MVSDFNQPAWWTQWTHQIETLENEEHYLEQAFEDFAEKPLFDLVKKQTKIDNLKNLLYNIYIKYKNYLFLINNSRICLVGCSQRLKIIGTLATRVRVT